MDTGDLKAEAVRLRTQNWSVNDIAQELKIARSTAWRWVRHLPLDRDSERARYKRAQGKLIRDAYWGAYRNRREDRRAQAVAAADAEVGGLSDREILLLGAAIYWCEGAKQKPWRPNDVGLRFTNSDPDLLTLFLRFLALGGIFRNALTYCVNIHESADASAAEAWWAERLGLPRERFRRATLKRHQVRTTRHNTGDDYHGCLIVYVPKSRDLYWRIEGLMRGIGGAAAAGTR